MLHLLQGILWFSLAGIVYTYLGYPLLVAALAWLRPRLHTMANIEPSVSVLVAAYNEESCIARKIENTLALDYPPNKLELVIVDDGSTDRTAEIVRSCASPRVLFVRQPTRSGKPSALLRGLAETRGEVIAFTDANTEFEPRAIRKLVRHFADPEVGGSSGTMRITDDEQSVSSQGEGLYWRYETFLKQCDSLVSSVMGASGAMWAVRRVAYTPAEPDAILEDFVASLRLVERGWRLVFDGEALAFERTSSSLAGEWHRRTRMAAGGWQSFFRLPKMLHHPNPLITFQYLSHRMLRWMVTPTLFVAALLSNLALVAMRAQVAYDVLLAPQVVLYGMALLGWAAASRGWRPGWLLAPFYVVMLNAAALVGGWRYLAGQQSVLWRKGR